MGSTESVQRGYPYKNLCKKASSWEKLMGIRVPLQHSQCYRSSLSFAHGIFVLDIISYTEKLGLAKKRSCKHCLCKQIRQMMVLRLQNSLKPVTVISQ